LIVIQEMTFEEKIISAILDNNDREVISTLYKVSFPPIKRTLKRQGAMSDDIQDALQDAMVILVRKIRDGSLQKDKNINSFLFIISRNLWINKVKRDNKSTTLESYTEPSEWDNDIHFQSSISEKEQTIRKVIDMLGEKCANVFKSILFHGHKYKDVAEEYGFANEGVVKIIKSRCKDKLIKLLQTETELRDLFIEYDQRFTKYI